MCKCSHAGSSSRPTQHISRGFFHGRCWEVSWLLSTCDLVWFLFTLLEYKGQTQTVLFPFCHWNSWEPENGNVSFLFKLQALLSWKRLSSGFGSAYFPAGVLLSKFLPTSSLNFLLKTDEEDYPTSPLAQMLSAAAGLMQEGLSPSLSWGVGQGFRHTGGHRSPRSSCIQSPVAEFVAQRLMPSRLGDAEVWRAPFKTDGGLRGPLAESWGRMCSLPLTWPTLFILFWKKKFIGSTCKW